MQSSNSLLPAVVFVLALLLPSSCWGVHHSHHTNPRGSDDYIADRDSHSGGTIHEPEPAIAPRGKHFSWHSSWQRGKKVTVLSIEPDTLRDRRSVLRHNVTRHNVRHRHGSVTSNNQDISNKNSSLKKVPDSPTFFQMPRITNYNREITLRGKAEPGDFNTLQDFRNYVNENEEMSGDKSNLITPNENPYTRLKKHASDRSHARPNHNSRRDYKSIKNYRLHGKLYGKDPVSYPEQQKHRFTHESRELYGFQKSANDKPKLKENNSTGNRKIDRALKENGKKYREKENDDGTIEGELLEFLERRRRDDGARNLEMKNDRIRKRRAKRRSRIEARRQRRRERKKLRRRLVGEAGGGGEQGDQPAPPRVEGERRRNGRGRSKEEKMRNPLRNERRRQRIAERRKRRKERRLRRRGKHNRGRSLDLDIAGLSQDNKSMLNGSNACQFRDLFRCARETFARDTGPKPADTIPRCMQRKSFLSCMQQQRTSRGDCNASVKALGDLQALRKYIREAMFTNSSCIIAESITG